MTFEEEGGNFLLQQNIQLRAQTIIIYFQMLKTYHFLCSKFETPRTLLFALSYAKY